jgi:hypothetical protein
MLGVAKLANSLARMFRLLKLTWMPLLTPPDSDYFSPLNVPVLLKYRE